ncbi:MAG: membrane carboxypeptidase/penicillin-binding protein PbpC, partial [Polaribacter sp.]
MKIKKILLPFVALLFLSNTFAQDAILIQDKAKEKAWYEPDYAKMQFAGNLGV